MDDLLEILENQKEVKDLAYFVYIDRYGIVSLNIGTYGFDRKYTFKTVDRCLENIVDILMMLKGKEIYYRRKNGI